jgi:hypothetical protein
MKNMKSMSHFISASILSISLACLVGCASSSPVKKFHTPWHSYKAGSPEFEGKFEPWSGSTRIVSYNEDSEVIAYLKDGYDIIGSSDFYIGEGYNPTQDILKLGEEIKADLAMWKSSYYDTVNGSSPVFSWVPGTSSTTTTTGNYNSNLTGNSYNSNYGNTSFNAYGTGNYSGQSTTTTPGYMAVTGSRSYSVNRNANSIGFLRMSKPGRFGFNAVNLSSEEQQKLGKNHGVKILYVTNGSRFFDADIMDGDVMLEVNGNKVHSGNLLKLLEGDLPEYVIKFQRGDEVFEKTFNF